MIFREAVISDIPQIQIVRHSVKENILTDPGLVTDSDCAEYLEHRGKGWICESENQIVGFAIADIKDHNIWALFVHPAFEKQGIGRKLHDTMMDWYFLQTDHTCWLGTDPMSRAASFYRKSGWIENGLYGKIEIKFEMKRESWLAIKRKYRSAD